MYMGSQEVRNIILFQIVRQIFENQNIFLVA